MPEYQFDDFKDLQVIMCLNLSTGMHESLNQLSATPGG